MDPRTGISAISGPALAVWLACLSACGHARDERPPAPPQPPLRTDDCSSVPVEERLRSEPSAPVFLMLAESNTTGDLSQRQDRVLSDLSHEFRVGRRYASMPALAGQLTRAGFTLARNHPDVRCVQLDGAGQGTQLLP